MKRESRGGGLGEGAFVGDCTVQRESDITGDERCKEKFTCRLSMLEAKYAFLNSQSLEQMAAGDASDDDAMATLDFDEFIECLARCARDKYGEIKLMSLADGVRGVFQNILGEKSDEASSATRRTSTPSATTGSSRSRCPASRSRRTASGSTAGRTSRSPTCTTSRCGRRASSTACRSASRT